MDYSVARGSKLKLKGAKNNAVLHKKKKRKADGSSSSSSGGKEAEERARAQAEKDDTAKHGERGETYLTRKELNN